MTKRNLAKKKSSTTPSKRSNKGTLLAQIFNPTYLKILSIISILLISLAVAFRCLKSYLLHNPNLLLSPEEFVEQHGITVLKYLSASGVTISLLRLFYYRCLLPFFFAPQQTTVKTKSQNRNRGIPRLATQDFEFTLYKGDRPWKPEEQSQFEQQLGQMGVPVNDADWNQFATCMPDRTGTDLKWRYGALTKALQKAEQQRKEDLLATETQTLHSTPESESEDNDLQWWLDIGLKHFDEKNSDTAMYVYDAQDDEYEYEKLEVGAEEEEEGEDRSRAEIELHPKQTGTEMKLEGSILLHKLGTVRIDACCLHIQCTRCNTTRDIALSGTFSDQQERVVWCSKCKTLLRLGLRPVLMHASNTVFGHVDTSESVNVVDVLPSSFVGTCEVCYQDSTFEQFQRGRRMEKNCTHCGIKLAMFAKQIVLKELSESQRSRGRGGGSSTSSSGGSGSSGGSSSGHTKTKASKNGSGHRLVLGENLPLMGACKHFKKSLKWMRFSCCGKVYPCPHCHELGGECEDAATKVATRMVCGKCSLEQSFTSGKCTGCLFHMGKGGRDTRQATMSKKDKKKKAPSSSSSKKTVSKKSQRVGVAGKVKREKAKMAKQTILKK